MPRPRIYLNDAEKQATYRRQRAKAKGWSDALLKQIEDIQKLHRRNLDELKNIDVDTTWFVVTVKIDRPTENTTDVLLYTMSMEELRQLIIDYETHHASADGPLYGTYAFAASGDYPRISGMATLCFDGLTIENAKPLPNFNPPAQYAITQGALNILRIPQQEEKQYEF